MAYRIGVISDTHYPTRTPYVPYEVIARAFRGVDQIAHLGDIESPEVLERLAQIAPVTAVRGDDDLFREPPLRRVLTVGGVRVGLVHGQRSLWVERVRPALRRRLGRPIDPWNGMQADLLRWFAAERVQAVLFGHWHRPYCAVHAGVLLFNPGAVWAMTADALRWQLTQRQGWLRDRFLRRHLKRAEQHPDAYRADSTVGILTIHDDHTLHAEVISLPPLQYPAPSATPPAC